MPDLLESYLQSGDCTEKIRRILLNEIREMRSSDADITREHLFNRFYITMNSGKDEVLIGDDLLMENPPEVTVTIEEFARALGEGMGE